MSVIKGITADDLYVKTLSILMDFGDETHPRGFTCQELSPCHLVLTNPFANILTNPVRKASQVFMAAELLWILMGRNDVQMISHYLPKMRDYSDDGKTFFGAYGPRIMPQLPYIVDTLRNDPWSRQAVLTIWRESPPQTRDFPCTISMQFIQRPLGKLNLIVYMRSQDAYLGLPYDLHAFTSIQLIVASILGIGPGKFDLIQGSLHLYEQDFDKIKDIMEASCSTLCTPPASVGSIEGLWRELSSVKMIEQGYRENNPVMPFIVVNDPMLSQKLRMLRKE